MVAFTDHARSIGVDALSNYFINFKNTINDLMILLGKPYKELQLVDEATGRQIYPFRIEEAPNGQAAVIVRHLGEERKFTITQVLAMLLTKLRGIAGNAADCVISCPQFYTDQQRYALFHAALIAGLNPLQIITDMVAVALNYTHYRTTKDDARRYVAFINFGQSNLQCIVAAITPKKDIVRVVAAESEPIGGRDFDRLLADYFIKEHNLNLSHKAYLKLISECEKLKRKLSANSNETPIHVESLISEDKDFTSRTDRATFENLCSDLFYRVEQCLQRAMDKLVARMNSMNSKAAEKVESSPEEQKQPESNKSEMKDVEMSESGSAEQQQQQPSQPDEPAKADDGAAAKPEAKEEQKETKASPKEKPEPTKMELKAVEMVGGSTRMPAFRQIVQKVFNIAPSTTLNTDEAVVRGCVLHCATLHPGMKVKREVKIKDAEQFPRPSDLVCDTDCRRVELELINTDRKYMSRTEARNSLEEFIYSERSKLQEGDKYLEQLSEALDWLFSDDGEEATEDEYNNRLKELKKVSEARFAKQVEEQKKAEAESDGDVVKTEGAADAKTTGDADVEMASTNGDSQQEGDDAQKAKE